MNTPRASHQTTEEWLMQIGTALRQRRTSLNLTQQDLADQAGVAVSALKHLEAGKGAQLTSLIKVVRMLGAEDWLAALSPAPEPAVSPMQLLREQRRQETPRRRVRPARHA
jgi:transcriptional regulator with XRE-family HTH domain